MYVHTKTRKCHSLEAGEKAFRRRPGRKARSIQTGSIIQHQEQKSRQVTRKTRRKLPRP